MLCDISFVAYLSLEALNPPPLAKCPAKVNCKRVEAAFSVQLATCSFSDTLSFKRRKHNAEIR